MSNAVAIKAQNIMIVDHIPWSKEWVDLLKKTICKDSTDLEFALFCQIARRTQLDPFTRQIHAVRRWSEKNKCYEMVVQTGIDGYRAIANRSDVYAGSDDPIFDDEQQPNRATVTVYKMVQGQRCPFTATARWDEYYPGEKQGFMWKKMPCVMLGKCAEALALRKAFPAELSDVYTEEEMQQAGDGNRKVIPEQPGPEDAGDPQDGIWRFPSGAFNGKTLKHRKFTELTPEEHRAYIETSENYAKKANKPLPRWWNEYLELAEPVIAMAENGSSEPGSEG